MLKSFLNRAAQFYSFKFKINIKILFKKIQIGSPTYELAQFGSGFHSFAS